MTAFRDVLEPDLPVLTVHDQTPEFHVKLSTAISLKRIADSMEFLQQLLLGMGEELNVLVKNEANKSHE